MWGWRTVEILSQNLRLGARQLRRSPGFTAVAVLTLALGIGVNTAIFSLMNAVMLRTLPVREPRRLVVLHSRGVGGTNRTQTGFDETSFPEPVVTRLRTERRVLTDLIAFAPLGADRVAVRYGAAPAEARVDMVSGNFFSGLGVAATAGRVLTMADETGQASALAAWMGLGLDLAPDSTVLGFTLLVSLLTGLLFGLAPLRHAVRAPVGLALRASTATALHGGDRGRGGQAVVALQMAICLIMLVCAGLLVRTLRNLESEKLGMRASALLVFGLDATSHSGSADPSLFYRPLLARLRALPGVEAASLMENRIGSDISNNAPAVVDGARPAGKGSTPMMRWNLVGPDYFHTLGIPVLLGRDFAEIDAAAAPRVAIVNHTFAERYLPQRPPLGHRIALSREPGAPQFAIVGVVADSKYTEVREEALPIACVPYTQASGEAALHLVLRTAVDPAALLPSVRRAVGEVAPDLPLLQPMTLQQQFQQSYRQDRLFARLALFFGFLSALLVATGLFGTLAIRVGRRTAEIGVRMALGARRLDIQWMVLRASLGTCLAGAIVGAPLAVACARLLRSQLFGLQPGDPAAFAAAVAGITLVALAASLVPAHRAASVDPLVAVRSE